MNFSKLMKDVRTTLVKHSSEILTGIGVAGMVGTVILAVKATPKALELIEDAKYDAKTDELTVIDTVKVAWKPYIPATITGVCSLACIIGASSVNVRRNAALTAAYTISETALRDYKDKVIETIGEKKEKEVRDAIAKDKIDKNPVVESNIVLTDKGETLCYDIMSGRYFKSSMETMKRVENELNRMLLDEGSVCLNDFYYLVGKNMDPIKLGYDLGWDNMKTRMIDLNFSSQLSVEGTPCLVIDFQNPPSYDFYK